MATAETGIGNKGVDGVHGNGSVFELDGGMRKSLVYGPVTSRRLGLSVGVDMVPFKVCSFDCVYCQIGRTEKTTVARSDFGLLDRIFEDLERKLESGAKPDHITLGGSGEPTMNLEIGKIIRGIKKITTIPVAVLTNGSLLWDQNVRDELSAADIVLPSIDAADQETYQKINRAHPDIAFDRFVEGVISFSHSFGGQVWVEIFLIKDINTSDAHLAKLKQLMEKIRPDRVHLNTAVRPPAESFVFAVDQGDLQAMAVKINYNAEVIAEYKENRGTPVEKKDLPEDTLIDVLLRRPCTTREIAVALNTNEQQVTALADRLVAEGRIRSRTSGSKTYYLCKADSDSPVDSC